MTIKEKCIDFATWVDYSGWLRNPNVKDEWAKYEIDPLDRDLIIEPETVTSDELYEIYERENSRPGGEDFLARPIQRIGGGSQKDS